MISIKDILIYLFQNDNQYVDRDCLFCKYCGYTDEFNIEDSLYCCRRKHKVRSEFAETCIGFKAQI